MEPDQIDMMSERDLRDELRKIVSQLTALQEERDEAREGLMDVLSLIEDSEGVYGLHLNGDVAPWDSLRTGGQFEEWLLNFDKALEKNDG